MRRTRLIQKQRPQRSKRRDVPDRRRDRKTPLAVTAASTRKNFPEET
jgi:hypothetical protein